MAEWLTIKEMSEKYGIDEENLQEWSNLGYIASLTRGNEGMQGDENIQGNEEMQDGEKNQQHERMLDEESFVQYLDDHKVNEWDEDVLLQLRKEEELQRQVTLSRLEDELFLFKTHHRYASFFPLLIKELATVILDERQRNIFLAIALGEPISEVASRYNLTYQKALTIYNSIIDTLSSTPTRIITLCQCGMGQPLVFNRNHPNVIFLVDLFGYRLWETLSKEKEISTLYDLLDFAMQHGWSEIRKIPGIEEKDYEFMLRILESSHYITINENHQIEMTPGTKAFMEE